MIAVGKVTLGLGHKLVAWHLADAGQYIVTERWCAVIFGSPGLDTQLVYERLDEGAYECTASKRVQGWLDGIKSGGDFQKGFNMWLRLHGGHNRDVRGPSLL